MLECTDMEESTNLLECYRCGGKHKPTDYRFQEAECNYRKKKGYVAKVCHSKARTVQKAQTRILKLKSIPYFFHTKEHSPMPILVMLHINGIDLEIKLDTGATLSLISE